MKNSEKITVHINGIKELSRFIDCLADVLKEIREIPELNSIVEKKIEDALGKFKAMTQKDCRL